MTGPPVGTGQDPQWLQVTELSDRDITVPVLTVFQHTEDKILTEN